MTKNKKIINALIFIGGLIVFLIYYFEDNTDTKKVEEKQEESAESSVDSMLNVLNEENFDFEDGNFEVSPSALEGDSIVSDSL